MDILTLLDDMCEFDPERHVLGEVVAFIVKAMRSYSNNKDLQRVCCVLIARVSERKENWSSLLKGECVETVIVASVNFMEDAAIQHHALEFFSRIATDPDCRESIRTHDGVRSILEVMTNNAEVKHVQQFGGITLNLLAIEESGANLLSQGKMDILFEDYVHYANDDEVMVPIVGIFALYSRDIHRDYIARMLEEPFLKQLVEFLQTRRGNVKLESEVYEVISNLCADAKANQYFMDHGVSILCSSTLREENAKTMTEAEKKLSIELVINLCHAVRCLLKGREVKEVVDNTLLELFRVTLEAYRKESDAVLALLDVYQVLVKDADYVKTVTSTGVLTRFFALYKEYIHFWMIETCLFKIFRRMSEADKDVAERVVNTGVIEDASLFIQGYARRAALIKQAMKCFLVLLALPTAFAHFVNSDIIMYVVQLLPIHVEDRKVLDVITCTLVELARPEVADKFVSSEAVHEDLAVMKKYESTEVVQESCMRLMSKLVWIIDDFTDDDATEVIERVLIERRLFSESLVIAKHSTITYNYFAQQSSHIAKVQQADIVTLLVQAIDTAEEAETVMHAGQALAKIAGFEELKNLFFEQEGHEVALKALETFKEDGAACLAMFNMLNVVLGDRNLDHVESFIMSDKIENLTMPIQIHNENKELIASGLDVIAKCCVSEFWSGTIALMDLPKAVLDTMRKWIKNAEIVSPCLIILACAAREEDGVTALVESGVYDVTLEAMKIHKLSVDVCKGAMLLLDRLTDVEDIGEGVKQLGKQPVIDLLIDVIAEYIEERDLIVSAVGVISDLVSNDELGPLFLNVPTFDTIAKLISRYANESSILDVILRILLFIKSVDLDCAMRIQTHFLEVYSRLIEEHIEEVETVTKVMDLAAAMTEHTEACVDAFPHFMPVILSCGEKYAANAEVTELFAKILFHVSKQASVVAQLYEAKVVQLLVARLAKYAEMKEEVIRYYICALSYIMVDDETTRYDFKDVEGVNVDDALFIISSILYDHFKNGKIGAAYCYLVSTFTGSPEDVGRLKTQNVPGNVYDTVMNNLTLRSTVLGAFAFYYRLLMSSFGHEILDHDDCMTVISHGMQSFPEDIPAQLKGVKVLREYSLHRETVEKMKTNETIERLVDSLNVASDEVNSIAFIALRNMCTNCEEVQVLDATSLPSVNDDICEAQMQRQVVDAINRCLLREIDSIAVMTNVMELIVCLSACSKPAVSLQIRGAMSSMVKYWKAKMDRLDMCVLVTSAFALLAVNNRFLPTMHTAGVTEMVFQELGMHEWNNEQVLVAIRLLAYISRNDEASRYVVHNGMERVMLELNGHVKNIQISRTGCQLLYSLCERAEHHDALIAAKIISYYQALMAEFSKDRTILMESLKILATFCRTPSDITMLTNEHVTESVLNVLAVNADQFDYEIMKLCTDVLIPFSLQKSVRPVVLEAGVFTTMIPILPRLSSLLSSDLIRQVFLNMLNVILNTVGEDVKGAKLFTEAAGVASLIRLLEDYPSSESVDILVDILHHVVAYESSYAFFWEDAVVAVFLRCFSNTSFSTEQMNVMLTILNVLLKAVTKEKAACVKDSAVFAALVEVMIRYVADAATVNQALIAMNFLLAVDANRFCVPMLPSAVEKISEVHKGDKMIVVKLATNLNVLCDVRRFRHMSWIEQLAKPLCDIVAAETTEEEAILAMLPVVGKLCRKEKMAAAIAAVPMVSAIFVCMKTVATEAVFNCCCNVLLVLVRNCPAAVAQFVDANSPRAIYDGLYKYMTTEEVVGVACSLLHILLSDSAVGFDVLTLDDVTPMKDLMKNSWDLKQTVVRDDVLSMGLAGMNALGNKHREEEKALKRLGAPEVVEEVVRSFAIHSVVHARMALMALVYAAMTDKGKKSIVEKRGVQAEMEAIEEFSADKEACSNGLNALSLMTDVTAAQKLVVKYGVGSILSVMRRHTAEKEVLLFALKALSGLREVKEVCDAIGREGGIPAVVEVWRLYAEEEEMVKLGAVVLKMATRSSEASADELVGCNAVQTLLEVLEQYASEPLVMSALCELMAVMATNAQAKKRFIAEDVISTLVVMISSGGKEDAEMIGAALHALMSLLSAPFDTDALQGQDIVSIIVDAFLVVLDSAAVNVDEACLNCMNALRVIAQDEDKKRELVAGDGKEVLEKVLSRASRDLELSSLALDVLVELCDDRDSRNEMADEDMVSAVVDVMKHYPFSVVIQRNALVWLASVSSEDYTREGCSNEETAKAVIAAMRNCMYDREVADSGCLFLANCSDEAVVMEVANKEHAGLLVKEICEKNGSAKTVAAMTELKKVLSMKEKKEHRHHHHHHHGEKKEGEESKRHHHHHHRSEKKEGEEGAEGAEESAKHRHRSRRAKKEGETTEAGETEAKSRHHSHRHRSHRAKKEDEGANGANGPNGASGAEVAEAAEGAKRHHSHRHHSHRGEKKEGAEGEVKRRHRRHRSRKGDSGSKRRHHSHRHASKKEEVKETREAIADSDVDEFDF